MNLISGGEALFAAQEEFEVQVATTPDLVRQCYELRHQVYCIERNYLQGSTGLELDEFDARSENLALTCRRSGEVVGTVRLVLGSADCPDSSFPMQAVTPPGLLSHLPIETTAEVSRFAISKVRRGDHSAALMRLGLVKGLVDLSEDLGITHWCAIMERSLLRLLRGDGICFHPAGPMVEYHGMRQPCFSGLDDLLDGVAAARPDIWSYIVGHAPTLPVAAPAHRLAA